MGNAGTLLYNDKADFAWVGGHHANPGRIIPREQLIKHGEQIKAPKSEYKHGTSFIAACKGETKTHSPFSVAGTLTEVIHLGIICQYLNTELNFDPKKKQFIGNDKANFLLSGPPPRKGWEEFYGIV